MKATTQSKKGSFSQSLPSGIADKNNLPDAFLTGLEAAAPLISALAASSNALGGPKQLKEMLAKIEPVVWVIEDSVQSGDMHVVTAVFHNQTPQGIYLESFELVHPIGSRLKVEEVVGYQEMNDPRWGTATLPYLLASGMEKEYKFKLPLLGEKAFLKEPYASAALTYSKLDEKSTAKKDVVFRLRRMRAVSV